jgi:hypothetical protein
VSAARKTPLNVGLAAAAVAVVALSWFLVGVIRSRGPYHVDAVALSGWTLVTAPAGDPALVALQPPPRLATDVFQQLLQRTGRSLVTPVRSSVPLVLRDEYADSLQGVLSVEDILDRARDAGIEAARFEPVCLGQRGESAQGRSDALIFVVFDAPVFDKFRDELTPLFPEHAGAVPYNPKALHPILAIATTCRDVARWWPIALHQQADCVAVLEIKK